MQDGSLMRSLNLLLLHYRIWNIECSHRMLLIDVFKHLASLQTSITVIDGYF